MEDTKKKKQELENLEGLDGYYYTGEVNSQTTKGNEYLSGEVDQYTFRSEHSTANNYHGQPDYNMEEDWRDWDKTNNDLKPSLTAEQKELQKQITEKLEGMADIEALSVSVFSQGVIVSGRVKGDFDKSEFSRAIKEIPGVENLVNHLCCVDQDENPEETGPYRVISQDVGLGEERP